ncbi:sensor domain-containing diguanylate cyclase [Pseudoalteromonas sp. T1lg65]|uniref:sensor domain-containing diguanylate cyclase n=1 Tax=Pseudoalteromonas sp. T1lg65 TaxID=2077101 RepID=UPI003F7A049C
MNTQRYRYNVMLTILLLAGFIFTSWYSVVLAKRSLTDKITDDTLPLTSHIIDIDLQKRLQAPIIVAKLMANNTFLKHWLTSENRNDELLFEYLATTKTLHGALTSFLVLDEALTYYRYDGLKQLVDPADTDISWYYDSMASHLDFTLNVKMSSEEHQQPIVYVNHKVRLNNRVVGIIGIGVPLADIQALIEKYQQVYQRDVYFIDYKGRLLFHEAGTPEETTIKQRFPEQAEMVLTQKAYKFSITNDEYIQFVQTRYLETIGWHLIVEQHVNVSATLNEALKTNLAMGTLVTVTILGIALFSFNHYQKRLENMAKFDKLTNAINRQAFEPLLQYHINKAQNQGVPLVMLMLDIDHFKLVNDKHGHQMGDKVLANFAAICQRQLPSNDLLCRWGGEEFMILLPKHQLHQGLKVADQIHSALTASACDIKVTASIGVAQYQLTETEDSLIKRTDKALYQAKKTGRNQTMLAA